MSCSDVKCSFQLSSGSSTHMMYNIDADTINLLLFPISFSFFFPITKRLRFFPSYMHTCIHSYSYIHTYIHIDVQTYVCIHGCAYENVQSEIRERPEIRGVENAIWDQSPRSRARNFGFFGGFQGKKKSAFFPRFYFSRYFFSPAENPQKSPKFWVFWGFIGISFDGFFRFFFSPGV